MRSSDVLAALPDQVRTVLSVCAEGCYKHYVKGLGWVCCKCGS